MIDSQTKLIGLIGHPVIHSKSPVMHNEILDKLGLNYRYMAFDVEKDKLEVAVKGMQALGLVGFNVTIPHKVNIIPFLDDISEDAAKIGAINTVVNSNGKLIGYNTDGDGYVRSLIEEGKITLKGSRVLLVGAGGAARAIACTLAKRQLEEIIIVNRNQEKAKEIIEIIGEKVPTKLISFEDLKNQMGDLDIIINTTSIGMYPNINESLIPKDWIKPHHIVSDIVYNPYETKLLYDAKIQGATIHYGIGMFVYQGAIAFEKWTGIKPDVDIMRNSVMKTL